MATLARGASEPVRGSTSYNRESGDRIQNTYRIVRTVATRFVRFRFVSRIGRSRVSSCGVGWCTSVLVVVTMAAVIDSNLHFNHDCARRTCVENTFSPRTTAGARTVTFMGGSDNPSANVSFPGNVHAHPTVTNDGAGLDNVSTADPSAFHSWRNHVFACVDVKTYIT